jgi:heat shock protein HtpX
VDTRQLYQCGVAALWSGPFGGMPPLLPADGQLATTAHLMIANPLRGDGLAALFATHPPMAAQVARLEQMAGAHLAIRR